MGVVSGVRNNVAFGVQFGGDGRKFLVTFAIEIIKRGVVRAQRRTQVGLHGQRRGLKHCRQIRAVVPATQGNQFAALRIRKRGKHRLLIPVGKDVRERFSTKTRRPAAIGRQPRLSRARILQPGMTPFNDNAA